MRRFVFAALLVSTPVIAQEEPEVDGTSGPAVAYPAQTLMDFEVVEVDGVMQKPSGIWHQELVRQKFNPLIRVRQSFDAEMSSSVDDIK